MLKLINIGWFIRTGRSSGAPLSSTSSYYKQFASPKQQPLVLKKNDNTKLIITSMNFCEYSKSKLLTTKVVSHTSGLSSRKVNSWFVDNKLMYKKGDEWFATKKGSELGAKQKEGSYGKFIVWPEEILGEIK